MHAYKTSLGATSQRVVEITERLAHLLGVLRDVRESEDETTLALIDIARELADRAAVSGRAIRSALLAHDPHPAPADAAKKGALPAFEAGYDAGYSHGYDDGYEDSGDTSAPPDPEARRRRRDGAITGRSRSC